MYKLKTSSPPEVHNTGTLQIGDQWNAIRIIAQSQTHPLKAVCELVENAIDARASNINIIRRRSNEQILLEVVDDGNGVRLDQNGQPDFQHIATHICDSIKRRLTRRDRVGVHGEFGIGLLSFWSLGGQLRMISGDRAGQLHEMVLNRGDPGYSVSSARRSSTQQGTQIVISPLLDSTRNVFTGEKLRRYLAAELRDRIRTSGVRIRILDKISRKRLIVTPREFQGDRLTEIKSVRTPYGKLLVELYLRPTADQRQAARVAVCKDGTRVLEDVTELVQFDHSPWNDGRLEGILDFPAFSLAPGTRKGIVPDEYLEAFIQAVCHIEPGVDKAIQCRDQAESAKANRRILQQVKRAFMSALRELPDDQYLFFDVPSATKRSRNGEPHVGSKTPRTVRIQKETVVSASNSRSNQLDTVVITPRNARRSPESECVLAVKTYDSHGRQLPCRGKYRWSIVSGKGRLDTVEDTRCTVIAHKPGQVIVEVQAQEGVRSAADQVVVTFVASDEDYGSARGLPSYRLQAARGQIWRSRYDVRKNEIIINSAHGDFFGSKATMAKHRRYIGKLYAKEVVLLNFPHESSSDVMERLIKVIVRTEDAL